MMNKIAGKWCLSENGEEFNDPELFDTKKEAINYARENEDYEDFDRMYVGQAVDFKPKICAERVIEDIQENACELGGEYAENYLDDVQKAHTTELQQQLQKVLDGWIDKNRYNPNFYIIKNSEEFELKGEV